MSQTSLDALERADVFFGLDEGAVEDAAPVTEAQYTALLHMMSARLGLTHAEMESIFPHDTSTSQPLPSLCAHLAREGAAPYHAAAPAAHTIPAVRCCDAREMRQPDPLPGPGRGPHVHCLRCFHRSIEAAPPPGPGAPPPLVADYRDSDSLRAHVAEQRARYSACLHLLDSVDSGDDALAEEDVAACEAAAEEAGRHVCIMASLGTAASAVVVFYCTECRAFAPLVRFHDVGAAAAAADTGTWIATDGVSTVLSRLLLGCHVLHMLDAEIFERSRRSGAARRRMVGDGTRHLLFLFKPLLFSMETEASLIDRFEAGAECTYAAVVLPNASVSGDPPQLLLRDSDAHDTPRESSRRLSPVVIGFAMEWATAALAQEKVDMVLEHTRRAAAAAVAGDEAGEPSSSPPRVPPPVFEVTTRLVYIIDTEEWAVAHVLYHQRLPPDAELPLAYDDVADDGIRVQEVYEVDVPMPAWADAGTPSATTHSSDNDEDVGDGGDMVEDGCPYSMESRTINFFLRMTALAKAMRELAVWRLTVDENKDLPRLP
ncbi:hypothetical protein NESM_000374500 [Novymonas esmeraldas]|uniref:Uncharacterized protein n=1 Tax=Novymonas esmeraldas TaxID=1808958 RepID=A0AAW0EKH6_9TRYP